MVTAIDSDNQVSAALSDLSNLSARDARAITATFMLIGIFRDPSISCLLAGGANKWSGRNRQAVRGSECGTCEALVTRSRVFTRHEIRIMAISHFVWAEESNSAR